MIDGVTVPVDRRQILKLAGPAPKCAHCEKPLLKVRSARHPDPEIEVDRNALGELIAWCVCRHCGKTSALML